MAEPYIGEIRMFAGTYAPKNWSYCDGQVIPISQYDALYSLLGTTYGGDGRTTFGLPDLRGRIPLGDGQNPVSSTTYNRGQMGGQEQVTLKTENMPSHTHAVMASDDSGSQGEPMQGFFGVANGIDAYAEPNNNEVPLNSDVTGLTGDANPVEIMQPTLCIHFIIALQGIYPPQS